MTPWERKLWYEFLKNYHIRFQRQKAIGNYIADFYCAKAKLVIELDGGGHYETVQLEKDAGRTEELETMDLTVFESAIWTLTAILVVCVNRLIWL